MKKNGILNSELSKIVAEMGHGNKLVICDAGLPIPLNSRKLDLAVSRNIPGFLDTLKVVMQELVVESVIIADELISVNHGVYDGIKDLVKDTELTKAPHEEFKSIYQSEADVVFVRTGETSPYANIILVCGVDF